MVKYLCELNKEETNHIDKVIRFIYDDTFEEHYEYGGNFAICSRVEDWEQQCSPCCGQFSSRIYLPTGRIVFFCFDFGH